MRGLLNGMKKNEGVLEGLLKGGILARKEAKQKALETWIAADPQRQKEYGDVLPALAAMQAEAQKTRERDAVLGGLYQGSTLLGTANQLYRLSLERPKKDVDRDPTFQERNWTRMKEGLERMQRTYDNRLDRPMLRYALLEAAALPADQRIAPARHARRPHDRDGEGRGGEEGRHLPRRPLRRDEASREGVPPRPLRQVDEGDRRHEGHGRPARRRPPPARRGEPRAGEGERREAHAPPPAVYMRALLAQGGGLVAPDANSTLRVTFGRVMGVDPRDGMRYLPQTTLQGVVDKHTGEGEFNVPARELEAVKALRAGKKTPYFDAKLGDVPVDFMSDVDTTGGNSGSAVLNSQGELVGLLFDGTLETVASDFLFDTEKTRSIQVDTPLPPLDLGRGRRGEEPPRRGRHQVDARTRPKGRAARVPFGGAGRCPSSLHEGRRREAPRGGSWRASPIHFSSASRTGRGRR